MRFIDLRRCRGHEQVSRDMQDYGFGFPEITGPFLGVLRTGTFHIWGL